MPWEVTSYGLSEDEEQIIVASKKIHWPTKFPLCSSCIEIHYVHNVMIIVYVQSTDCQAAWEWSLGMKLVRESTYI